MRADVEKYFDHFIISTIKKIEVATFLINHERKPRVIDNICEQIKTAEMSNIGGRFDINKYKMFVMECGKMFAQAALEHAEQKAMSHAEMQRRIDDARVYARAEETMVDLEKEAKDKRIISRPGDIAK